MLKENLKKIIQYYLDNDKNMREAQVATSDLISRLNRDVEGNISEKRLLASLGINYEEFIKEIEEIGKFQDRWDKIQEAGREMQQEELRVGEPYELAVETTDEPVAETREEPAAPDKATRIENKINGLIQKFEQEKNPIIRQIYSARISWLNEKFANALIMQQIREEFAHRRTVTKAENLGKQTNEKIGRVALEVQIAELKEQISDEKKKFQPRFDPESPRFIFKSELARYQNDLDSLLTEIQGTPDGAIIAQKIRDTVAAKETAGVPELESRLGELQGKLSEEKGATIGRKVEQIGSMGKLVQEELSLVSTEKKGILTRISDWGKALKAKWDERKKEKEAIKGIKAEDAELVGLYQEDVNLTVAEKEAKIAELKRQIASLQEEIKADKASVDTYKAQVIGGEKGEKRAIDNLMGQNHTERASAFRETLSNLRTNTHVDTTPKAGAENPGHENNEHDDDEATL